MIRKQTKTVLKRLTDISLEFTIVRNLDSRRSQNLKYVEYILLNLRSPAKWLKP